MAWKAVIASVLIGTTILHNVGYPTLALTIVSIFLIHETL